MKGSKERLQTYNLIGMNRKEVLKKLYRLLPSLRDEQIIAIYLRFWECRSVFEISNTMNWDWDRTYGILEKAICELRKGFTLNRCELEMNV